MPSTNGSAPSFATQEWESPEAHEWEGEWEAGHETHEWEHPESHEWEGEWEAGHETHEWEHPESHEWEGEWEAGHETHEWEHPESHEWEGEWEADPFLPFLAPLAAKALPVLARAAMPYIKRLLPVARRAIGAAVKSVLSPQGAPVRPPAGWPPRPGPTRSYAPARGYATVPGGAGSGRLTALRLVRRLHRLILRGEAEAAQAEAQFFGSGEMEWEVGEHPAAHEAALTEVLAAEAAHTASEAEAEALLGAALPITIRIVGGRRSLRGVTPTLVQVNSRLVRGLRRSGPGGAQLLRMVPTIQRRTVASLRTMQRSGQTIRPGMVAPIMAAHTARVLGVPRICGPALLRNTVIRQRTVTRGRQYRRVM
jgi:hypothetical protein